MLKQWYLRVLNVAVFPANLVAVAVAVVLAAVWESPLRAVVAGCVVGSVYEFACRRAGRRIGWPFDTPGARRFAELHSELAVLQMSTCERAAEVAAAKAENDRIQAILEDVRARRVDGFDSVCLNVVVDEVQRDDEGLVVSLHYGSPSFLDVFTGGERRRVQFSDGSRLPWADEEHRRQVAELNAQRAAATSFRFRFPDTPSAALFVDDLRSGGGSIVNSLRDGSVSTVISDRDGIRSFSLGTK